VSKIWLKSIIKIEFNLKIEYNFINKILR
jgi:hypothetical protein